MNKTTKKQFNVKDFIINAVIFLLVFSGGLLVSWQLVGEEAIVTHFLYVPINHDEFPDVNDDTERDPVDPEDENEPTFDFDAVDMGDAFDWIENAVAELGLNPIGEIILPSIDVNLPVFLGLANAHISFGAGTSVSGIVMGEGNYVLASHWNHLGLLFGHLYRIQVGDILLLRDANYFYVYETIVGNNHIIEAYRVDILDYVPGRTLLTLFTCTPDGSQRVMVRGEFVEKISIAEFLDTLEVGHPLRAELDAVEEYEDDEELEDDEADVEDEQEEDDEEVVTPTLNIDDELANILADALEENERVFPWGVVIFGTLIPFAIACAVVWVANNGLKFKKKDN